MSNQPWKPQDAVRLPSRSALEAEKRKILREATINPILPKGWGVIPSLDSEGRTIYSLKRVKQLSMPLPNGEEVMVLGDENSEAFKERDAARARRDNLNLIDLALSRFDYLDEARKKVTISPPSIEWYTPPEIIETVRSVLGHIELDPASNDIAQDWIKAQTYFTKHGDGLSKNWRGRTYCNPPYGRMARLFLLKGLDHYRDGDIPAAIFLVNRTGAEWYLDARKEFAAICEVRKRIEFVDTSLVVQSRPRYYSDILYLGSDVERFKNEFEKYGETR